VKENSREQGLIDKDMARKFAKEQARARKEGRYTNRSQYGCRKIVLTLVIWFSETMIICAEQIK